MTTDGLLLLLLLLLLLIGITVAWRYCCDWLEGRGRSIGLWAIIGFVTVLWYYEWTAWSRTITKVVDAYGAKFYAGRINDREFTVKNDKITWITFKRTITFTEFCNEDHLRWHTSIWVSVFYGTLNRKEMRISMYY